MLGGTGRETLLVSWDVYVGLESEALAIVTSFLAIFSIPSAIGSPGDAEQVLRHLCIYSSTFPLSLLCAKLCFQCWRRRDRHLSLWKELVDCQSAEGINDWMSEWMEGWMEEWECLILPHPSRGQGLIAGNKEVQLNYFQVTQVGVCAGASECPGAGTAHLGKSASVSLRRMEAVLRHRLPKRPSCPQAPPSVSPSIQEWFSTGLLAWLLASFTPFSLIQSLSGHSRVNWPWCLPMGLTHTSHRCDRVPSKMTRG